MNSYIFDLETDGLLDTVTTVHSLVLRNLNDGTIISCCDAEGYTPIDTGISFLNSANFGIGRKNVVLFSRFPPFVHPFPPPPFRRCQKKKQWYRLLGGIKHL